MRGGSWLRLVLGFAAAPLAGAVLLGALIAASGLVRGQPEALGAGLGIAYIAAAIAVPATLIVGAPLYLVLRTRLRFTALRCALIGAGVAVCGILGYVLIIYWPRLLQGAATFAMFTLGFSALAAPLGALGGWVFWRVALSGAAAPLEADHG